MSTKDENIEKLEKLAKRVKELKQERYQRRPLLIEFCGSPKSGKSTTINSLNIFLKRNEFKTKVLTERASVCPVKNKKHPFFNIWTLTSALAEIIQHLDQGKDKVDIIIADRGIFDALCWFEWLNSNPNKDSPHLDDSSYKSLKNFVLMDMWLNYVDLVYVFKVSPETSINREYSNLLTEKRGSIMDEPILNGFNDSINKVVEMHSKKFRKVTTIETDTKEFDGNPNNVGFEVTSNVLDILKDLLIEKIGYFDKSKGFQIPVGVSSPDSIQEFKMEFDNRDTVEKNTLFIQPIPIVVITNKERDRCLVVKKSDKRTSSKSPEFGTLLTYLGGHIREEDKKNSHIKTIDKALHREIQEEIGESISFKNSKPFLIYTDDNPKSKQHFAVCYIVEMDLSNKKFKLTSDEFIMKTGKSKSGQVLLIKDIVYGKDKMESWSELILKEVFKTEPKDLFSDVNKGVQ